jgi:hypothetical protein
LIRPEVVHFDSTADTYAATAPAEDFAETFMLYLRFGGTLPARHASTTIKNKWKFIRRLSDAISKGQRRW